MVIRHICEPSTENEICFHWSLMVWELSSHWLPPNSNTGAHPPTLYYLLRITNSVVKTTKTFQTNNPKGCGCQLDQIL